MIQLRVRFTKGENIYLKRSLCKIGGSWSTTQISLCVISAVGSHEIRRILAHDADSTPCDFSRPIARFNCDHPIAGFNRDGPTARFNPDRLISLFTPQRHHVGIYVGLRGPATCPHRATSPRQVLHDSINPKK